MTKRSLLRTYRVPALFGSKANRPLEWCPKSPDVFRLEELGLQFLLVAVEAAVKVAIAEILAAKNNNRFWRNDNSLKRITFTKSTVAVAVVFIVS